MAKTVHDDVLDQALNYIKNNASRWCVCSAQPTTYTEAITTYKLADVDVTSADYTGPANGDTNGRKVTMNAKTGVTVDTTGTALFNALVDVSNTKLLYVTTCTSQALTAGNLVNIPAWDVEIADPT